MYWRFFLVVYKDNTASLKWSYLSDRSLGLKPGTAESEFSIEMLRQTKQEARILLQQPLELRKDTDEKQGSKASDRLGTIYYEIPFPPETTHIRIRRRDLEILMKEVLKTSPSLHIDTKKVTPKGDQVIRWSSTYTDKSSLYFSVFIESDGKRNPIASKIRKFEVKVPFDKLPGCKRGRIVVKASEGFYTVEDSTEEFDLPYRHPKALIAYPHDGDKLSVNEILQLRGWGFDMQARKHVPPTSIEWKVDGVAVGIGRLCVVSPLKAGKHSITLSVIDESGNKSESKIGITLA